MENYHKKMLELIEQIKLEGKTPTLLLHTCCAPCSTTVIKRLSSIFSITVLYYNPNIEPREEYEKRKQEQIRFLKEYPAIFPVSFLDCDWDNEAFLKVAKGYEMYPEGGLRCHRCYELRLMKTGMLAKEKGFDYFTTSLTISPYKNSKVINEIGKKISDLVGVPYLFSDFKKENGYLESIQNSKEFKLYRQNYCGCHFSQESSSTYKPESCEQL